MVCKCVVCVSFGGDGVRWQHVVPRAACNVRCAVVVCGGGGGVFVRVKDIARTKRMCVC